MKTYRVTAERDAGPRERMVEMTYRVKVTREEKSWLADVPNLPGTHTWAGNLVALDAQVREAICLVEDLPEGAEADLSIEWD